MSVPGEVGDFGQSPLPLGVQRTRCCLRVPPGLTAVADKCHLPYALRGGSHTARDLHLCRKQAQREPSWRVGGRLGALPSPKPPAFSGNRCEGPQRTPEPRPHAQAGAPGCLGREPAGPRPAAPSAGAGSWPSLFRSCPSAFARASAVLGGALGVSTDPSGAPHGSQGVAQAKWEGSQARPVSARTLLLSII